MIEIKKFNFDNKELCKIAFSIRHKVFVIGQNCPENIEYEFEEESTHFLVYKDGKPLATARYRETSKGIKMERFAVLEEARGKGYGMQILKAMLKVDLMVKNIVVSWKEN